MPIPGVGWVGWEPRGWLGLCQGWGECQPRRSGEQGAWKWQGIEAEVTSGQHVTRQGKEGAPWKEPVDTCSSAGAASESVQTSVYYKTSLLWNIKELKFWSFPIWFISRSYFHPFPWSTPVSPSVWYISSDITVMRWYVDQISWSHMFLLVLFFALAWLWIFPRDCWHPPGREQKTNGKQKPFSFSFFHIRMS